jgi:hypothetical protein
MRVTLYGQLRNPCGRITPLQSTGSLALDQCMLLFLHAILKTGLKPVADFNHFSTFEGT